MYRIAARVKERDYAVLALLVGCGLRRRELAALDISDVQQREGRWVIADFVGKAIAFGQLRSLFG